MGHDLRQASRTATQVFGCGYSVFLGQVLSTAPSINRLFPFSTGIDCYSLLEEVDIRRRDRVTGPFCGLATHRTSFLHAGSIALTSFSPRRKRLNFAPNSRLFACSAGRIARLDSLPTRLNGCRCRADAISSETVEGDGKPNPKASKWGNGVGGRVDLCKRRGRY